MYTLNQLLSHGSYSHAKMVGKDSIQSTQKQRSLTYCLDSPTSPPVHLIEPYPIWPRRRRSHSQSFVFPFFCQIFLFYFIQSILVIGDINNFLVVLKDKRYSQFNGNLRGMQIFPFNLFKFIVFIVILNCIYLINNKLQCGRK